jgi:hypothetical protein
MTISATTKNAGFTLIEFQLYLFLLVVMLALLGGLGIHVLESRSKAHTLEEINYSAQFVFGKLNESVTKAEAILEPAPNESSNVLSLQMSDPDKNPTTFTVIDGVVTLTQGVDDPVIISSGAVFVTELSFINTSFSEFYPAVRTTLGIDGYGSGVRRPAEVQYLFYTSLNLKN